MHTRPQPMEELEEMEEMVDAEEPLARVRAVGAGVGGDGLVLRGQRHQWAMPMRATDLLALTRTTLRRFSRQRRHEEAAAALLNQRAHGESIARWRHQMAYLEGELNTWVAFLRHADPNTSVTVVFTDYAYLTRSTCMPISQWMGDEEKPKRGLPRVEPIDFF